MTEYILSKSKNKLKKWSLSDGNRTVNFGAEGYEDYTIHKDAARKQRYIDRHSKNEDWNKSGIETAGWLSRFILWEKPNLQQAVKNASNKYKDVKFKLK